ncbi:MAG: DUF1460 domain-containing protein [Ignavibacteria bacterium]|nr:DUF1460 domain-containing protein [Ignavibacteria bacterium]
MFRRDFLRYFALTPFLFSSDLVVENTKKLLSSLENNSDKDATSWYIFDHIIAHAKAAGIAKLSIGERLGKVGMLMLGTPYVGGTLEGDQEVCRIDLTGLDCVTFFENVLGIARIMRKGDVKFQDLTDEIVRTRYRDGKLDGYTSRLHYTADWIANNVEKGIVKNITQELGGVEFPINVSFMSNHPQYYPPLVSDSTLIPKIAKYEQVVNSQKHYYIPSENVKAIQPKLQTGDIIAVATNKEGLDYAHTGIALRDERGNLRFLHASLTRKRVFLDKTIATYLKTVPTHIGITVARPLEVNG